MKFNRMPIEVESPEEKGYATIKYNLAESSVRDIRLKDLGIDLNDLVLNYGHHRGDPRLQELIVSESNVLKPSDVLVTTGAATALFIVATTLLDPKDHLIVIRPNYGTNLETPKGIGCDMTIIDLHFENGFQLDITEIKNAVKPNTKLISITSPHNPTGVVFLPKDVEALTQIAETAGCHLLSDETYRDLNFQTPLAPYLAEKSKNVISVCSLSKAFGTPGIRIGWIISKDEMLMKGFLAAKEQIIICNSVVDESIAIRLLEQKEQILLVNHDAIRANFQIIKAWMERKVSYLEWVEPCVGVVCFPKIKPLFLNEDGMRRCKNLHLVLYEQYATVIGPGHWFDQNASFMRLGFGFPLKEELITGLDNLHRALSQVLR